MSISKVFISELSDNSSVETLFLVASKSIRETRNGDPYLCVTLQDRSGTIEARGWDDAEKMEARFEVDDFVAIRGRTSSYRGELQITLADLERVDEDQVELSDFLPHSRWSVDTLFDELQRLVRDHVQSDEVRRFLFALFDDELWRKKYLRAPAAVSNHHAYLAGLAEHSLSMARLAITLGRHYDAYYPGLVDTDLLIAGCIVHDMAKTEELEYRRSFAYTTEGRLVGHVVRGAEIVGEVARSMTPALDEHFTIQLKHLILSHHGKKEYGAPVTPKSPEAILLHYLDMIDSRMNMCWNACEQLIEGDDGGDAWSDYQRNFGSSLYIGGDAAQGWKKDLQICAGGNGPGIDPSVFEKEIRSQDATAQPQAERRSNGTKARAESTPNLELFGDEQT